MGFLSNSTSPDRMRLVSGIWNAFPVEKQMHIVSLYDKPHAKPDRRPFCVFALERVLNNLSVFLVEMLLGPSELSRGLSEPGIGDPQTDRGPSELHRGLSEPGSGSLRRIGDPQRGPPESDRGPSATGSGSLRTVFQGPSGLDRGLSGLDRGPSDWIGDPQTGSGTLRIPEGAVRLDRGPSDWIGDPQNF